MKCRNLCEAHYRSAFRRGEFDGPTRPKCSMEGCPDNSRVKGMCQRHYLIALRFEEAAAANTCTTDGCLKRKFSMDMCQEHFNGFKRSVAQTDDLWSFVKLELGIK